MSLPPPSPAEEYARRLEARLQEQERLARWYALLLRWRRVLLGLIVVLAVLADHERLVVKLALFGVPALLLEVLIKRRVGVGRSWRRAAWSAAFYERRLACLQERWAGGGEPGARYLDDDHPCALDLDLFGPGCLYERLCTAQTRPGQDALAGWLLAPATADEARARQAAVEELRGRVELREELARLAAEVPAWEDFQALAAWAQAPPALPPAAARVPWLLAGLTAAALAGWVFLGLSSLPLLAAVLLQIGLAVRWRGRLAHVLDPVEVRGPSVRALGVVLARLEAEAFSSPVLRELHRRLTGGTVAASARTARLGRLLAWVPLAVVLAGKPLLAVALDRWRRAFGRDLARWVTALGQAEALAALASYAFDNPDDPFPELRDGGADFEAEGLGHPLLPRGRCVRNDVRLGGELRLLVVSGSNMSGKSTLLRAVGVNAVLGLAGAPVRARALRLAPLAVGATLRVQDSLQAGRSRFYAEVLRVRRLLEMARGSPPLLFLLDELFQGTNSHDRRVGAEGVVRRLLEVGAVGLVTTHDLALTDVAERLAPAAVNVHFEDSFAGGEMTFDYTMKPGVVRTSNGLALMRAVGIEV